MRALELATDVPKAGPFTVFRDAETGETFSVSDVALAVAAAGPVGGTKLCANGCCVECPACASRPGSPTLCADCMTRRDACNARHPEAPPALAEGLDAFRASIERAWARFQPLVRHELERAVEALGYARGSGTARWQGYRIPLAIPLRTGAAHPSVWVGYAAGELIELVRAHVGPRGELLACEAALLWGGGGSMRPEIFPEGADCYITSGGPFICLTVYARPVVADEPAA